MSTETLVKEFSYAQDNKAIQSSCCIIRRETPNTETGITWVVQSKVGNHPSTETKSEYYAIAEMEFKNFVLESLNTDIFYKYSAEK